MIVLARLTLLAAALLFSACAHGRKAQRESGPAVKISGSMGVGVSSGGYGRHRHP